MRSIRYWLAISLVALPLMADACWHPWTLYNSTSIFRISDDQTTTYDMSSDKRHDSCVGWQKLTSRSIPLEDIEEVVYTMPIEEYEALCDAYEYDGDNAFAEWIKRYDNEILELLLLAKRNEELRDSYTSAWYYPTMKVGGPITLEEVVEVSLAADTPRLRDRYLLQAIRALTTLKRYDECIALWESEVVKLPAENVMRRHILPYVAGAYYHTGSVDYAMELFAAIGDTDSMTVIARAEGMRLTSVDILSYAYASGAPLSMYERRIRKVVVGAETYPNVCNDGDKPVVTDDLKRLRTLALKAGSEAKGADRVKWLYIAAYIYMQEGRYAESRATLTRAQQLPASKAMQESIKLLDIFLDANASRLDAAYDARLLEQLKWLEQRITEELNTNNTWYLSEWHSSGWYDAGFWEDCLSRLIHIELAPRYIERGDAVRALLLKNYAEYFTLNHINYINYYPEDGDFGDSWGSLSCYRADRAAHNEIDYSNRFFVAINEMSPDVAIAYVERVSSPRDELDRHLVERGYNSSDYLNDIAGTLCLRHMRYREAEKYLARVSYEYTKYLNVQLTYDPFRTMDNRTAPQQDFRYRFARHMASLERGIEESTEDNRRAMLMFEMGVGISNSMNDCWPLVHYHRACCLYLMDDWEDNPETKKARRRGMELIQDALLLFTDDEYTAQAHYVLGHYKTVVKEYPYTPTAQYVERNCDNLIDYSPSFW